MKTKPLIVCGIVAVMVVAYAISTASNLRHRAKANRTVAALKSLSLERLTTAAHGFARDHKVNDRAVTLGSLLSAGYLRPEDVRGLEGEDVSISLTANETTPSAVLVRVRESNRFDVVLRSDGSIAMEARR